MTPFQTTSLNATHHATPGARMVDFNGWEMPLHYGSQIEEHIAVRSSAGMFDVSHMAVIDITGDAAQSYLSYLLANDVRKLATPGRALYSCLLNESGGVIDDLIVYFLNTNAFRLIVNAGTAEKDLNWFKQINNERKYNVDISLRRDLSIIAVQGPMAREKVWQVIENAKAATESLKPFYSASFHSTLFGELMIGRTGYTGEDGFELIVENKYVETLWKAFVDKNIRPCGLAARDTLRLEAGMNLYGQDMDENTPPLDTGLNWTVNLSDSREFIGRLALETYQQKSVLLGVILLDKGGMLRAHQKVFFSEKNKDISIGIGEITSGSFSPTLKQSIGFARISPTIQIGDIVQIAIREKLLNARVVKLPFVRNGKILADGFPFPPLPFGEGQG